MRISDLDIETKTVLFTAHAVHRNATAANMARLGQALEQWDAKHSAERITNLLKALDFDLPEVGEYKKARGGKIR